MTRFNEALTILRGHATGLFAHGRSCRHLM